ncbi:MAG: hypothetical protein GYB31_17415 [Bacteroidetes bacterium]|nr:hypothetical protein [Bacteroidota bacterium]
MIPLNKKEIIENMPALISGKITGEIAEKYYTEIKKDPELFQEYIFIKKIKNTYKLMQETPDSYNLLYSQKKKVNKSNPLIKNNTFKKIAAVAALILICFLSIFYFLNQSDPIIDNPYPIKTIFLSSEQSEKFVIIDAYLKKDYKESLIQIEKIKPSDPNWLFVEATSNYYLRNFKKARKQLYELEDLIKTGVDLPEKGIDFYLTLIKIQYSLIKDESTLYQFSNDNNFPGKPLAEEALEKLN